jgi:hypothetical protein
MELIQTRGRDIRAMDTEVLNHKLHCATLFASLADKVPQQELVCLGLNKGSVIMLNMRQLQWIFVRLTIHREAITLIRYLSNVVVFCSFCKENNFKVWRCHSRDRKAQIIHDFKLNKSVQTIVVFNEIA